MMKIGYRAMALGVAALAGAAMSLATAAPPKAAYDAERVLYSFGTINDGQATIDGVNPYGSLILVNGSLYGTTYLGGSVNCSFSGDGCGTVFKLTPTSAVPHSPWKKQTLYNFGLGNATDGSYPRAGLIADDQGSLYGTTSEGGLYGYGTVFKLTPAQDDGDWAETVLYNFTGGSDGAYPYAALIFDQKGRLYSTTYQGGAQGYGTVFQLAPPAAPGDADWKHTVMWSFDAFDGDGRYPLGSLIFDDTGALYGTTEYGGTGCSESGGCGTVFKLTGDGLTVLYSFCSVGFYCDDGSYPQASLIFDKQGALYGTTYQGGGGFGSVGLVFQLVPPSVTGNKDWTQTVIHAFDPRTDSGDGANPSSSLIADSHGALYGTTYEGGGSCWQGNGGCGTIFKLTPPAPNQSAWKETILYAFTPDSNCNDGAYPLAGLVADTKKGALYGTTYLGGGACSGAGTVFKVDVPLTVSRTKQGAIGQ